MSGFTCHHVNVTTCCKHSQVSLRIHGRRPRFLSTPIHHSSFKSAVHLLQRIPMVCRTWMTFAWLEPDHQNMINPSTHTFLSSSFQSVFGIKWQLMNEGFMWAVAYLNVSVWLMAASITSMSLFKRHQVTISKSGSKEELCEWTDLTIGRVASEQVWLSTLWQIRAALDVSAVTKITLYCRSHEQRQQRWKLPQGPES